MPWTEITRPQYRRASQRYASDLTDDEWRLLEPLMPKASRLGRPRTTDLRTVVDGLLYMASTGCQWRQLPKDFPPYSTVQGYFYCQSAPKKDPPSASKRDPLSSALRPTVWPGAEP